MLLRQAALEYSWTLNYGAIALMWRGGCIIRRFVRPNDSSRRNSSLPAALGNVMSTDVFHTAVEKLWWASVGTSSEKGNTLFQPLNKYVTFFLLFLKRDVEESLLFHIEATDLKPTGLLLELKGEM